MDPLPPRCLRWPPATGRDRDLDAFDWEVTDAGEDPEHGETEARWQCAFARAAVDTRSGGGDFAAKKRREERERVRLGLEREHLSNLWQQASVPTSIRRPHG